MAKDYKNLKENYQTELKESSNAIPSSVYETYSSFANTSGGNIYLGIKEKSNGNQIVGVSNPEKLTKDLFNTLNNPSKVSRNILSNDDVTIEDINGKQIICIHVPKADVDEKPIYLNGNKKNSFKRDGEGDHYCTENEILAMQLDSTHVNYDIRANALGLKLEDMSKEALSQYRSQFNQFHPNNIFKDFEDIEFFKTMGCIISDSSGKDVMTNAGVALFGNCLQIKRIYPNYFLDYMEIENSTERWTYRFTSDDLTWSGNLFDFFRKTDYRLSSSLPNPFELDGPNNIGGNKLKEAVREGVLNAIFNASFFRVGGIKIICKPKSLTIRNAGGLMLPFPRIIHGGYSYPRNEGIMTLFRQLGLGERAGQGVPKIFSIIKELRYPEPTLGEESEPESTNLTFDFSIKLSHQDEGGSEYRILSSLSDGQFHTAEEISKRANVSLNYSKIILNKLRKEGKVKDNGKKTRGRAFSIK